MNITKYNNIISKIHNYYSLFFHKFFKKEKKKEAENIKFTKVKETVVNKIFHK